MRKLLTMLSALAICLAVASSALAGSFGEFSVKDIDGKDFKTENLKGKRSVIVFVQAACGQCRSEINEAKSKAADLAKKADIYWVVVDVNTDRAIAYFKDQNLPGKILIDPTFSMGEVSEVSATPATLVVEKDLTISKSKVGYRPGDVDRLIKELQ